MSDTTSLPPRSRLTTESVQLFGIELSTPLVLLFLSAICIVEFVLHIGIDGELIGWAGHTLLWGHATGPAEILNGYPVHFEGFSNMRNAQFFAGDHTRLDLSYNIPTSRLYHPFVASFFNLVTYDIVLSTYLTNLLFWIFASWAAYGLGKHDLDSPWLGLVLGILVATGQIFISKAFGTKTHLSGYSYAIILIFLAERVRVFEPDVPVRNYLAMGLILGVGGYFNGTQAMGIIYVIFMGIARNRMSWRYFSKLLLAVSVPVVCWATMKALQKMAIAGGYVVGGIESVLLENALNHLKALYDSAFHGKELAYIITSLSGTAHHTTPLGLFAWIPRDSLLFLLIGGIPIVIFCVAGLVYPKLKPVRMGVLATLSSWIPVCLIMSYWPVSYFLGYLFGASVIGMLILAALGICNITNLVAFTTTSLGMTAAKTASAMRMTTILLLLISVIYTNQDILFGFPLEHVRIDQHYFAPSSLTPFPANWKFDYLDW